MNTHPNKVQNVISLTQQERYDYFVRKTADSMHLWGLFQDGWAISQGNSISIPFWPEECFAQMCATAEWSGLNAKCIEMDKFLENWLPGMERDNRTCLIFPTPTDKGLLKTPQALKFDLRNELSKYE
ncbi:DUF2750 domain-containing protein [Pseudomonas sp. PS01297]|uniref:DUF2750 domain-containing protein n=1 Tax=Pseudomonas sp. PS01297 TaxID=2991433 RepID=UPI00249BDAA7|nr:DUF2750 domain-containing protein [Pseudomonas sp. PS01297]